LGLILADGETHRGAMPVHVHASAFAPDLSRSLYEVGRGWVIHTIERELTGQNVRLTDLCVRETVHCHRCFGGRDSVDCPALRCARYRCRRSAVGVGNWATRSKRPGRFTRALLRGARLLAVATMITPFSVDNPSRQDRSPLMAWRISSGSPAPTLSMSSRITRTVPALLQPQTDR